MYIRCACGTTMRVQPTELDKGVTCISCGRQAKLNRVKELGSTSDERFRRARDFAREKKIDLASAYSVLLGIIPIEKAVPLNAEGRYDRGFNDAIHDGVMTVQQAIERGDRAHFASRLQQKHGLPMDRAFLVTDNRMTLAEALDTQSGVIPSDSVDRHGTRTVWSVAQVAVALVIACAGMYAMLRPKEHPPTPLNAAVTRASTVRREPTPPETPPPPAPPETVTVQTDAFGRVTEISGPDPKTVLLGLCKHAQFSKSFSPIAMAPSVPPSNGSRLGFVRDIANPAAQRCVSIHRDARTGRWSAGDGRQPLEIQRAPVLPPGTVLTPL